jgi:hypothetical protein
MILSLPPTALAEFKLLGCLWQPQVMPTMHGFVAAVIRLAALKISLKE